MQATKASKLKYSDIGYRGRCFEDLNREELLSAFHDLAQRVFDCNSTNKQCGALLSFNQGKEEKSDG
jgi:hypothetical protein